MSSSIGELNKETSASTEIPVHNTYYMLVFKYSEGSFQGFKFFNTPFLQVFLLFLSIFFTARAHFSGNILALTDTNSPCVITEIAVC